MRDSVLEVTSGSAAGARRVDGRNDLWEITVQPDSDADVVIVLPASQGCNGGSSVCARDGSGRMLSNRSELAVPGPAVNNPPTGLPAISGTVQVGKTLTADTSAIEDPDGLSNSAYSYQWLADGVEITGATSASYVLVDADVGKTIRVKVSFTDDRNHAETRTSDPTAAVEPRPNSPATALPTISGTAHVGETLTAHTSAIEDADGLSNAVFTYRWLADNVEIPGATSDSYTLVDADEGKAISVKVSFTDDANNPESLTSDPTLLVLPSGLLWSTVLTAGENHFPVGIGYVGSGNGSITSDTFSLRGTNYQVRQLYLYDIYLVLGQRVPLFHNPALDEGLALTTGTHRFKVADALVEPNGRYIYYGWLRGDLTWSIGDKVAIGLIRVNYPATGLPTISGTARVGETLTVNTGTIGDADGLSSPGWTYQWVSNDGNGDTDIAGVTASAYTLVGADEGKTIRVKVSFTDDANNTESVTSNETAAVEPRPNRPATGKPTISGTAQVGETLAVDTSNIEDPDDLSNAAYSYQWLADGVEIAGATSASYVLVDADVGKAISVKVGFTDDRNHAETRTSDPTTAVEPRPNSPATGLPTISGMAQVGETLTADTSNVEDADGLSNPGYSYQWLADGVVIAGATGATYSPVEVDVGSAIRVKVSFTDDRSHAETRTSDATAAVEPRPNSEATGLPTISGTVQVGETLTADTAAVSDADGLSNAVFTYRWLADNVEVAGATGDSYTLADADEGKVITVNVSFADDRNHQESVTSAQTVMVAPRPIPLTAWIEGAPESHNGTDAFTFRIAFSEDIIISYKRFQSRVLRATGGSEIRASRVDRRNDLWKITVQPDGDADVSVELPATGNCSGGGTVCASDGKSLSHRLELTVPGPVSTAQNSPATGKPTITGTARVGETLTAGTSAIADADGLTNPAFAYQWLADSTEIVGATSSSYTLVDTDGGKAITVRVSFTDDADNEEILISEPTAAVAPRPLPLTAEFQDPPESHDGTSAFTVRVSFSEDIGIGYAAFRDHSFEVEGGSVTDAKQVEGRNDLWEITVEPDSDGAVTVILPETTDCSDQGAVCARGDSGKKLSNRSELSVPGPAAEDSVTELPAPHVSVRWVPRTGQNAIAAQAATRSEAVESGEVVLTWTNPQSGATPTGYQVQRWIPDYDNDRPSYWSCDAADIGSDRCTSLTQYTDSELQGSVSYGYAVRLVKREEGELPLWSPWSDTVEIDVPALAVSYPPPPTVFTATGSWDADAEAPVVNLSWDAAPGATGYTLWRAPVSRNRTVDVLVSGLSTTTYEDTSARTPVTYEYRVQASNDAGASPLSASRFVHTYYLNPNVPGKVTGLTLELDENTMEATLTWNAPEDGGAPTRYYVFREKLSAEELAALENPANAILVYGHTGSAQTTRFVQTLGDGHYYSFVVLAWNSHGFGKKSAPQSINLIADVEADPDAPQAVELPSGALTTTEAPSTPGEPAGLRFTIRNDAVTLRWDAPEGDDIASYRVFRRGADETEESLTLLAIVDEGTTYTDETTTGGETYVYRVAAVNDSGMGPHSDEVTVFVPSVLFNSDPQGEPESSEAQAGDGDADESDDGGIITGFDLIDADNDIVLKEIVQGTVVDLNDYPDERTLNIRVNTSASASEIDWIALSLSGRKDEYAVAQHWYWSDLSLFGGDWSGDYYGGYLPPGEYRISAIPFDGHFQAPTDALPGLAYDFEVIDSDPPAPEDIPESGTLRLQDGLFDSDGRLEIYHDGEWGSVCDDWFDRNDANVACRQLGFSGETGAIRLATRGIGRMCLDDLHCAGTEGSLLDCPAGFNPSETGSHQPARDRLGVHNCVQSEAVSIACTPLDPEDDVDSERPGAQVLPYIYYDDSPRHHIRTDTVDGTDDQVDYYRFYIDHTGRVRVWLRDLDHDADIYIENSDGTVRVSSTNEGTDEEYIDETLQFGTYFIRVEQMSEESSENSYTLKYAPYYP